MTAKLGNLSNNESREVEIGPFNGGWDSEHNDSTFWEIWCIPWRTIFFVEVILIGRIYRLGGNMSDIDGMRWYFLMGSAERSGVPGHWCSVGSPEFIQKAESIFTALRGVVCECQQCRTYEPDLRLPASTPKQNHLPSHTTPRSWHTIDGGYPSRRQTRNWRQRAVCGGHQTFWPMDKSATTL